MSAAVIPFSKISLIAALLSLGACSDSDQSVPTDKAAGSAQYVFAFSWQPAFCEGASRKPECRIQNRQSHDANHFSLHGLWPQPGTNVYCGVDQREIEKDKSGRWRDLDADRINDAVWRNLQQAMPGTRSSLHKHEWVKHGTCTKTGIDGYFGKSIWLLEEINNSALQALFQSRIGKEVSGTEIRAAFEKTYGAGSGDRLRISCRNDQDSSRQLVVEITLGLADPFAGEADLKQLILAAPKTDPGCPKGIVDPAGF